MVTQVNRPFLDRVANVYSVDHRWKPKDNWDVVTQFVASAVTENGVSTQDTGMQIRVSQQLKDGWRQNLYYLHLGDDLQLNDFGYLDRNNFNYLRYEIKHRITDIPESSRYSSKDWGFATSMRHNDDGEQLYAAAQISRFSETRDGGNEYLEFTWFSNGADDLITRGHGSVKKPARFLVFAERFRPRRGEWELYGNVRLGQSGLENIDHSDISFYYEPRYYFSDTLSLYMGFEAQYRPDWLPWQQNYGGLATFESKQLNLFAGMQWLIGSNQELRVKLETIALDAKVKQAYTVGASGHAIPVNAPVPDFKLNNLGFQVR